MPETMESIEIGDGLIALLDNMPKPYNIQPKLTPESSDAIKNKLMLSTFYTRRLVAGASIACSGANGETDAYSKNEITPQDWNQNGKQILLSNGVDPLLVHEYVTQIVKEY